MRDFREERDPSSAGISPEIELLERSRTLREEREPRYGGISPEMLHEERLRICREERTESSGGRAERLRKTLGKEREMTRVSGEQLTPGHEHGVASFGFHDGSGDDNDDEMRERRERPSGDRAEMEMGKREMRMRKRISVLGFFLFF